MILRNKWVIIVVAAWMSCPASAHDVFQIAAKGCRTLSGAIVGVDDAAMTLLNLNGDIETVPLTDVEVIGQYQLKENPFRMLATGPRVPWA